MRPCPQAVIPAMGGEEAEVRSETCPGLGRGAPLLGCSGMEWAVTGLSQEITALLQALKVTSSVTLAGFSWEKRKAGIK